MHNLQPVRQDVYSVYVFAGVGDMEKNSITIFFFKYHDMTILSFSVLFMAISSDLTKNEKKNYLN